MQNMMADAEQDKHILLEEVEKPLPAVKHVIQRVHVGGGWRTRVTRAATIVVETNVHALPGAGESHSRIKHHFLPVHCAVVGIRNFAEKAEHQCAHEQPGKLGDALYRGRN